jgi:hypothetical protein
MHSHLASASCPSPSWASRALPALAALPLFGAVAYAQTPSGGTGTCLYVDTSTTVTKYYTNAFKVGYTLFGLFGSTQSCYEETTKSSKYYYFGSPLIFPAENDTIELRMLQAEAPCYGVPAVPNTTSSLDEWVYVGLDGTVTRLTPTPIQGTLAYFLGSSLDRSFFDQSYLQSSGWTGYKAFINSSTLVQPTLTYGQGGHTVVETSGVMDVGAPDTKVFNVDLGRAAAGTALFVVTSTTSPAQGDLLVVDGVTIPIVHDWFTDAFMTAFSPYVGIASDAGTASFSFPQLSGHAFEGLDLNVAVAAMDLSTGQFVAATTFATLELRDEGWCP